MLKCQSIKFHNTIMTNQAKQQTAVSALRAQLAEPEKIIVCPGVYDGFTARMALKAGFDCLYMVSNHSLSS